MMKHLFHSLLRLMAVIRKEFIQMRRDRLTFGMMAGVPLMQLILFGYAINPDPKHLPLGLVNGDTGPISRAIVASMQASGYYHITQTDLTPDQAREDLALGRLQFVLHIPVGFERSLRRGERPSLLLEADATDPSATSRALAAAGEIALRATQDILRKTSHPIDQAPPFDLRTHALYNPETRSAFNIVPGLIGVVLTMTMAIITALAMTRERERGTLEMLLGTPARPLEVLVGKIIPYILVAYLQIGLVLLASRILFHVPMEGSILMLLSCALVFVLANLGVGITFSTIARTQLQAVQMALFFFLPSILLTGFMFPFRGMPRWAQWVGEALPNTHFIRIARSIMLKGGGWVEVQGEVLAIAIFLCVSMTLAVFRYRQTMD